MTVTVTHNFTCNVPVDQTAKARGYVTPDNWNADHTLVGMDSIEDNLRGIASVNMASGNYTLTQAEAYCSVLILSNTGDGSKTLTIPDYSTNPTRYMVAIDSGNPVRIVHALATTIPAVCYFRSDILNIGDNGVYNCDSFVCADRFAGIIATDAIATEQIIRQVIIPAGTLGEQKYIEVSFNGTKADTVSTQVLNLRLGTAGTVADTLIYTNSQCTGASDNLSTKIKIFNYNGTSVIVQTQNNAIIPYNVFTANIASTAVSDMAANTMILSLTGTNASSVVFTVWTFDATVNAS